MKRKVESDPWVIGWAIRVLVLVAFVAAFAVPTGLLKIVPVTTSASSVSVEPGGPIEIRLGTAVPTTAPTPAFTATPHIPHVGIIAGHTGSDSGAICDDGLQEVDINNDIAQRVVALLSVRGWQVDQLAEFDARLTGYTADVLLSIHADSCNMPGKTGFKVARAEGSYIPDPEDRLVNCLSHHYAEVTGLPFDEHTITHDMRRYHAYYEINADTPAAIIEVGFMLDDRALLTETPEIVAAGIVAGLVCFVEGDTP